MTTFLSRELARDALVTLFTTNASWQEVYGYFPSVDEIKGKTPVLIIRGRGTQTEMANLHTNPVSYRFILSSMVLAYSASDNWTSANAEDKLDELDKVLRQVIRDNATGVRWDGLRFESAYSTVDDIIIGGLPYIVESHVVYADLFAGS